MADPPWDIHMELPYGTMEDSEMRKLPLPQLQSEGHIFLWVTGRAMELGRELLKVCPVVSTQSHNPAVSNMTHVALGIHTVR